MPALFRLSIFNSRFSGRHVWGLPQRVGGETLVFKQALSVWRDVFRTLIARISRRHLPIDQTGELLMAIGGPGGIHEASAGGITGEFESPDPQLFLTGTATEDQFNTLQLPLIPIACWGVDDIRFAFDSSFVDADSSGGAGPPVDIRVELGALKDLVDKHPLCPLSLFGHADPVGSDVYNKALSERRAKAIYALLIFKSEPDTALSYWQSISRAENWGADQQNRMQSFVGQNTGAGGSVMRAYMQKLSDPGPALSKTDFLAQGAGADRKGDFQGCSEFNPLLLFSQEKQAQFDQAKQNNDQAGIADRNDQNAINRRVLGLMFRKGSRVDPTKWPCPRASEGIAGCTKRFWSDGETRRSKHLSGEDRRFQKTADTFACRFYQRLAGPSPCEGASRLRVRLYDGFSRAIPFAPFATAIDDQGEFTNVRKADDKGVINVALPDATSAASSITIRWGFAPEKDVDPELLFERTVFLIPGGEESEDITRKRLSNLGYDNADKEQNIIGFQLDYGSLVDPPLPVTGELDDRTSSLVKDVYEQSPDNLRDTSFSSGGA